MTERARGRLVAVEGIDGSGKSTLARALVAALQHEGLMARIHSEPSKGPLGRRAREEVTHDPLGAALLFTLDRLSERAALERLLGLVDVVIADRTYYSTLAYQGSLLAAPVRKALRDLEESVARVPDLVLWLDGPVEVALARLGSRAGGPDRIEQEALQLRVRQGYRQLARPSSSRFVRLDFRRPLSDLVSRSVAVLHARCPELFSSEFHGSP